MAQAGEAADEAAAGGVAHSAAAKPRAPAGLLRSTGIGLALAVPTILAAWFGPRWLDLEVFFAATTHTLVVAGLQFAALVPAIVWAWRWSVRSAGTGLQRLAAAAANFATLAVLCWPAAIVLGVVASHVVASMPGPQFEQHFKTHAEVLDCLPTTLRVSPVFVDARCPRPRWSADEDVPADVRRLAIVLRYRMASDGTLSPATALRWYRVPLALAAAGAGLLWWRRRGAVAAGTPPPPDPTLWQALAPGRFAAAAASLLGLQALWYLARDSGDWLSGFGSVAIVEVTLCAAVFWCVRFARLQPRLSLPRQRRQLVAAVVVLLGVPVAAAAAWDSRGLAALPPYVLPLVQAPLSVALAVTAALLGGLLDRGTAYAALAGGVAALAATLFPGASPWLLVAWSVPWLASLALRHGEAPVARAAAIVAVAGEAAAFSAATDVVGLSVGALADLLGAPAAAVPLGASAVPLMFVAMHFVLLRPAIATLVRHRDRQPRTRPVRERRDAERATDPRRDRRPEPHHRPEARAVEPPAAA